MSALYRYATVFQRAQAEIIVKKSRFIATAAPVSDEKQAVAFLDEISALHKTAGHSAFGYCVAASCGGDKTMTEVPMVHRMSDAGEPAGTAGPPILDVIKGRGLRFAAVNVTRYFGGTLLGTGGLVRAYGQAASEAVAAAEVVEKVLFRRYAATVDYPASGKMQYETIKAGFVIEECQYADAVTFVVLAEYEKGPAFESLAAEITGGAAIVSVQNLAYGVWRGAAPVMDEAFPMR